MALTKHNAPELNGLLQFLFSSLLLLLLLSLSSQLCDSSSNCLPRRLSPPLFPPVAFLPACSSLQRGEKHSCQIQVGHDTVAHPHQLLRSRHFDANKFVGVQFPAALFPETPSRQLFRLIKQQRCFHAAGWTFSQNCRLRSEWQRSAESSPKMQLYRYFEKLKQKTKNSLSLGNFINSTCKKKKRRKASLILKAAENKKLFCHLAGFSSLLLLTKRLRYKKHRHPDPDVPIQPRVEWMLKKFRHGWKTHASESVQHVEEEGGGRLEE